MEFKIISSVVELGLFVYLLYTVVKLKRRCKDLKQKMNSLFDAVKIIAKLNLEKVKNEESKKPPFKPEDLEKIRGQLNVPN